MERSQCVTGRGRQLRGVWASEETCDRSTYALHQPLAHPWCHHTYFQVTRHRSIGICCAHMHCFNPWHPHGVTIDTSRSHVTGAYEYAVHICTASTPGTPMVSPYILPGHVLMKQMHCINVWHPFGVTIDGIYTYTSWSHVDGTYIYALHQPLAPLWCHHRWYIHVYFLVSLPVCAHPAHAPPTPCQPASVCSCTAQPFLGGTHSTLEVDEGSHGGWHVAELPNLFDLLVCRWGCKAVSSRGRWSVSMVCVCHSLATPQPLTSVPLG